MENVNETNAEIFSEMAEELTDSINSRRPEAAEKSSGLTLKSAASLAVVAIPVIAGILYLKDRKKIMNADTASAFMNMGNGNF